jgi:hypothetical protein
MARLLLQTLMTVKKLRAGTIPKGSPRPEVGQTWDSEVDQLFVGAVEKMGKDFAVLVTVVHDFTGDSELGATTVLMWSEVMEAKYELVPDEEDGQDEEDEDEGQVVMIDTPAPLKMTNRWRN